MILTLVHVTLYLFIFFYNLLNKWSNNRQSPLKVTYKTSSLMLWLFPGWIRRCVRIIGSMGVRSMIIMRLRYEMLIIKNLKSLLWRILITRKLINKLSNKSKRIEMTWKEKSRKSWLQIWFTTIRLLNQLWNRWREC